MKNTGSLKFYTAFCQKLCADLLFCWVCLIVVIIWALSRPTKLKDQDFVFLESSHFVNNIYAIYFKDKYLTSRNKLRNELGGFPLIPLAKVYWNSSGSGKTSSRFIWFEPYTLKQKSLVKKLYDKHCGTLNCCMSPFYCCLLADLHLFSCWDICLTFYMWHTWR